MHINCYHLAKVLMSGGCLGALFIIWCETLGELQVRVTMFTVSISGGCPLLFGVKTLVELQVRFAEVKIETNCSFWSEHVVVPTLNHVAVGDDDDDENGDDDDDEMRVHIPSLETPSQYGNLNLQ